MILEIIQSKRIQNYNFNLASSQLRALENILRYEYPIKFLLFIMDSQQKRVLLEFLFVAIFSDKGNENADECFRMFSIFIWYFHLENEGADWSLSKLLSDKGDMQFSHNLLSNLYASLHTDERHLLFEISEEVGIQETLSLDQLLIFK
jgi:hypothetical protein